MMDDWNGRDGWVSGRHVIVFDSRGHHERQPPLLLGLACKKFDGRHHHRRRGRDVAILVLVASVVGAAAPVMVTGLVRWHQSRRA